MKLHLLLVSALILASTLAAPGQRNQPFPHFTQSQGQLDSDGLPISGAKICIRDKPELCYQMPANSAPGSDKVTYQFGLDPRSERLPVPGGSWIFFTGTFSGGGSGMLERLAVLRYNGDFSNGKIANLLPYIGVTDQADRAMWTVSDISPYPLLVCADYIWNKGETHFARHYYRVEAWVYDPVSDTFIKKLSYQTVRKYKSLDDADTVRVLVPERPEILKRLHSKQQ